MPHVAEVTVGVVVGALVLLTDLRGAIGSSFGVLTYYEVANASAFTQRGTHRRYPRAVHVAGLFGCVLLAFAVPSASLVAGLALLTLGLAGRALVVHCAPRAGPRAQAPSPAQRRGEP